MRVHAKNRNRSQVSDVVAAHRKLLKQFNRVAYYVSGVCAGIYLPGVGETFDVPVRKITGKRPVFVTLEATPHGLMLSGAISRLKAGQMQWRTIFDYDFTLPMTWRGGGRVLSAKNLVIARVGLELLRALVDYADAVAANEAGELQPAVFPEIVTRAGKVVAENYTPVLGLPVANPAADLHEVSVRRYNAAGKVLARRGAARLSEIPEEMWPVVMAEFRAEYPDVSLAADVVLEALQDQREWIHFPLPADEALATAPEAVVQAIRENLPGRFRYEASHKDVLVAAANPQKDLRISRLSRLQMFPVETVQDLPEGYTGSVLSTVKMIPNPPALLPAELAQIEA
jgi:hypothetical protein